jgi:hypothetical protein
LEEEWSFEQVGWKEEGTLVLSSVAALARCADEMDL